MSTTRSRDERYHVYHILSRVLIVGIAASMLLMLIGFALLLANDGSSIQHLPSLGQLLEGVLRLDASSVIWFATLLLILTPIARVVAAVLLFIHERDEQYFFITLTVLILLIMSFLIGISTA